MSRDEKRDAIMGAINGLILSCGGKLQIGGQSTKQDTAFAEVYFAVVCEALA